MASWILVPSLVSLRNEFNELAPHRDKASDGSIGDTSHAAASSDHNPDETGNTPTEDADNVNEVHAIDVDDDLRKAGWSMSRCVEIIVTRHREGRDNRLQNVIWNRRIWSRSWGWTARSYNGPSPHTEHAHFSARYTTAQEADTRGWGLLEALAAEEDIPMEPAEFNKLMDGWAKTPNAQAALAKAFLDAKVGSEVVPTRTVRQLLNDQAAERAVLWFPKGNREADAAKLPATAPLARLLAVAADVDTMGGQMQRVEQNVASIAAVVVPQTPSGPAADRG